MKKNIFLSLAGLIILVLPMSVLAQGQQRVQDPASHQDTTASGYQVQNRNEVQTKNQGTESALQVMNQEQESLRASGSARQKMSVVAQRVGQLLEGGERGFGQQINEIAQEQQEAQGEIGKQLGKLESRGGFLKKLVGPDYRAIKNLRGQIEQNRVRIGQLEGLKNQLQNSADQTQVQEVIMALNDQNTALQEQVELEGGVGSLFGWLFKLFAK